MNINEALTALVEQQSLSQVQMAEVMQQVMTGQASPVQIAGLLVALRMKGETVDEISGAAQVMRELATPVAINAENLVDTCGTGGDGANIFNVSTAAAFVVAAAGGHVAKHGNRSVSSSSGSADVLEAAGVRLDVSPELVARAVESIGVGFMFAPAHHGAMKHAIGPRKELGLRTVFNMLGPMTNPAGVKRQVLGVFSAALCRPMAEVLQRLGSEHVMVVHADDGLDELSIVGHSNVAELKNGEILEYRISAADLGLAEFDNLNGLEVSSADESLALIKSVFTGEQNNAALKAHAIISLNAGAAIYVAGIASSLAEGVAMAEDAIQSGAATEKLTALAQFTQAQ
ncbi:anthranilate phosphoribosyltransferase [Agaribacterium sp. ZY112]|uniref:anthranilate phosphoribosyltransferase n=1 Tax=Agaribacterium sp. ZY112 TaxID=3233574 RepID=UPI003525C36F